LLLPGRTTDGVPLTTVTESSVTFGGSADVVVRTLPVPVTVVPSGLVPRATAVSRSP
jgi:hypothetical protein